MLHISRNSYIKLYISFYCRIDVNNNELLNIVLNFLIKAPLGTTIVVCDETKKY